MSTLKVTNIQDTAGANSLTTEQLYNGSAKAWVNFNGTGTVAIRASYNVSSITFTSTSNFTINFSTAMPDANYSISASVGETTGAPNNAILTTGIIASTSFQINVVTRNDGTGSARSLVCFSVFR